MSEETPLPKRKARLVEQTLRALGRVEAWLAWFCLGVRPGSVTERERQRNRQEFLRAKQELTLFCILFTVTVVYLEVLVARWSARAGLPHPYSQWWLVALPVIGAWALKIGQLVMNRRRRRIWKDVWR